MLPINLTEWSRAVAYERLTDARERRLASQAVVSHRWRDLRGWLACQLAKLGCALDGGVCRRAVAVCRPR